MASHPKSVKTGKAFWMPPIGSIQNASSVSHRGRICCPRRSGSTSHLTQKKNSLNNSTECLKLVDTRRLRYQALKAFAVDRRSARLSQVGIDDRDLFLTPAQRNGMLTKCI